MNENNQMKDVLRDIERMNSRNWIGEIVERIPTITPVMNLFLSLAFIVGVIVTGWLIGIPELMCLINQGDVGFLIAAIAILLFFSNVVRIFMDTETSLLLLAVSVGMYIFGFALSYYGFFWGVLGVGIFLFLINTGIHSPFVLILSMAMIIGGCIMRDTTSPTQREMPDYNIEFANDNDITWTMEIYRGGQFGTCYWETLEYTGTKDNAIAAARKRMNEIGSSKGGNFWNFDPDRHVNIRHIPEKKLLKKGYIIHYRNQREVEKYIAPLPTRDKP